MSPALTNSVRCTTLPRSPAAALTSSFSRITYWSGETSYPFTTSSYSTSRSSLGQIRRCSSLAPSLTCTSLKWTAIDSIAEYSFTGTFTSPNVIVPFQIERGIRLEYPRVADGNPQAVYAFTAGLNADALVDDPRPGWTPADAGRKAVHEALGGARC